MSSPDPFRPVHLGRHGTRLTVTVIPFGLTIQTLGIREDTDYIVGPEDPKDHLYAGRNFFGPIVGRFANRLPAGKSSFATRKGEQVQLDLPEWGGNQISHHGGPARSELNGPTSLQQPGPFDRAIWQHITTQESLYFRNSGYISAPTSNASKPSAIFAIESPDEDNGYPGKLRIEALIAVLPAENDAQDGAVTSQGRVLLQYRTSLPADGPTRATPLNLTHHWGFNLSASSDSADALAEEGRVDKHVLEMYPLDGKPVQRLELDEYGVANGKLTPGSVRVAHNGDHSWDQAGGKRFDDGIPSGGYDHFYVWGRHESQPNSDPASRRLRLTSETTGTSLVFHTNQAGAQLYTANGQPSAPADPKSSGGVMKSAHRHRGSAREGKVGNATRSAAFIEFGGPHAGFLRQELAQVGGRETLLEAGDQYDNWVVCEVWTMT